MEVTFSALKRSPTWVPSRGHDLKNPVGFTLFGWIFVHPETWGNFKLVLTPAKF